MKKVLGILLIGFILLGFTGCEESAERIQERKTDEVLKEMNNEIGLPSIVNFYEKKMAKDIFELRDDSELITYAYMKNMNGKFVYLGQCMGFGLPYSVQYTNPNQINSGRPQADPNGLYMPDGLSATWLMLINEETGKREIIYAEPEIIVTQSKLPRRLVEEWSLTENY